VQRLKSGRRARRAENRDIEYPHQAEREERRVRAGERGRPLTGELHRMGHHAGPHCTASAARQEEAPTLVFVI